ERPPSDPAGLRACGGARNPDGSAPRARDLGRRDGAAHLHRRLVELPVGRAAHPLADRLPDLRDLDLHQRAVRRGECARLCRGVPRDVLRSRDQPRLPAGAQRAQGLMGALVAASVERRGRTRPAAASTGAQSHARASVQEKSSFNCFRVLPACTSTASGAQVAFSRKTALCSIPSAPKTKPVKALWMTSCWRAWLVWVRSTVAVAYFGEKFLSPWKVK